MSDTVRLEVLPNHVSMINTFLCVKSQKITQRQSAIFIVVILIEKPLNPRIVSWDVPISSSPFIKSILQKLNRSLFRHVSAFAQNALLVFLGARKSDSLGWHRIPIEPHLENLLGFSNKFACLRVDKRYFLKRHYRFYNHDLLSGFKVHFS